MTSSTPSILHVLAEDEVGSGEVLLGLELTDERVENINKARELFSLVEKGGGEIIEVVFQMSGVAARKMNDVDLDISGTKYKKYLHGHVSEKPLFPLEDDEVNESRETSTFAVGAFGVHFTFTSRFSKNRYISMSVSWAAQGLGPKPDAVERRTSR